MGPRKNNAAAAGKDDGAALGKMRKVNPPGSSAHASAASGGNRQASTSAAVVEIGFTGEERAFLESQLALFATTNKSATSGGSPAGTDFSAMTKERWIAGLPVLVSTTEKLLRTALEQYQITCKNRAAAAAAQRGAGGGTSPAPGPSANTAERDISFSDMSRHSASHNNMSITEAVLPAISPNLPSTRPTPAAGTAAQFAEENAYIIAQAQQLQWYPFTYQRWLELLMDPGRYHTAKDEGRLRGDAIQASLRRCILVTYPAVEGGDCI